MALTRLDEPRSGKRGVGVEITRQISRICCSSTRAPARPLKSISWKQELQEGRIRVQLIYTNDNRRRAEQVKAALQKWDLTHNQPPSKLQRFSLHQRWMENFAVKSCAGHVLLVKVTTAFFEKHSNAVFVLRGNVCVGKGGKVRK